MSDNYQEPPVPPPPSYSEVIDKSVPPAPAQRAAMYTVPQQGPIGEIKYQTVTPTMPTTPFGVQVVPVVAFSKNPIQCTCGHCRALIITRVEQRSGLLSWLLCLFLALFGCWLGCCLIPFCIPDLQNVEHYCPNCNAFIGEYRPL